MIRPQDCEILQWRSLDDEAAFTASASPSFLKPDTRRKYRNRAFSMGSIGSLSSDQPMGTWHASFWAASIISATTALAVGSFPAPLP